ARDDFIDLCRAFSLLIVVLWHWVFTIVVWGKDGPSANSPLGFTDNLWILTWFLQVMPVFFFVGGHAHLQLWAKLRGGPHGRLVVGRLGRVALPALAPLPAVGGQAARRPPRALRGGAAAAAAAPVAGSAPGVAGDRDGRHGRLPCVLVREGGPADREPAGGCCPLPCACLA